jgi:hypothetical protein
MEVPQIFKGKARQRQQRIFMQGIYELQVLDNYNNRTYANGQAGSIYKQTPPLVNAMRKPGEWNVYDVIYTAPVSRKMVRYSRPARELRYCIMAYWFRTILRSGRYSLYRITQIYKHGKGPIKLQDHGDPSVSATSGSETCNNSVRNQVLPNCLMIHMS